MFYCVLLQYLGLICKAQKSFQILKKEMKFYILIFDEVLICSMIKALKLIKNKFYYHSSIFERYNLILVQGFIYQNSNLILMTENMRDQQMSVLKLIVVGESGVGKTNIISRYVYDKFMIGSSATIGVQFVSKIIQNQNQKLNLQIWDTAGQEKFRSLNKIFYQNALGALVVFSLADKLTFQKIPRWIKQIRQSVSDNTVLLLVGNKCDMKDQQVTVSQAAKLAKDQNMAYIQTSAAMNINIDKALQILVNKIISGLQKQKPNKRSKIESIILTNQKLKGSSNKKKCCLGA